MLTLSNQLQHVPVGNGMMWTMPCVRHSGHIYLEFMPPTRTPRAFYSKSQLRRLHLHLHNPSGRKLYDLLLRADPEKLPLKTR